MKKKHKKYILSGSFIEGFSLVEMIVTIAVFSIMTAIIVPSFYHLFCSDAKAGADKMTAALSFTRKEAMSRLSGKVHLYQKEDGFYYTDFYVHDGSKEVLLESRKLAGKRVDISYNLTCDLMTDTKTGQKVSKEGILLTYDRSTGGFFPLQEPGTAGKNDEVTATKAYFQPVLIEEKPAYVSRIIFSGGGKYYQVILHVQTGTCELQGGRDEKR